MLKKLKETSKDVAMFALISSLFFVFKVGETIYKARGKLKRKVWICMHCDEEIARGNGVDLGDGDCLCRQCYEKKQYVPTFLRKMAE